MNTHSLVICPVYNEERTLKGFYKSLRRRYQGDVLFVDDGSADTGADYLDSFMDGRTFLIRHEMRLGYGRALIDGFSFSLKNEYAKTVTIDADFQHDPYLIDVFLKELDSFDVVLGSRYVMISKAHDVPYERMLINRYIMNLFQLLYRFPITDPFCGYRGYSRSFLLKAGFFEESYGFALDVLLEMIRSHATYTEIPVEMKYVDFSREFYDGLNDSRIRLLHYLEVIERKRRQLSEGSETVLDLSAVK